MANTRKKTHWKIVCVCRVIHYVDVECVSNGNILTLTNTKIKHDNMLQGDRYKTSLTHWAKRIFLKKRNPQSPSQTTDSPAADTQAFSLPVQEKTNWWKRTTTISTVTKNSNESFKRVHICCEWKAILRHREFVDVYGTT